MALLCWVASAWTSNGSTILPQVVVIGKPERAVIFTYRVIAGAKALNYCERSNIPMQTSSGFMNGSRAVRVEYFEKHQWIVDISGLSDVAVRYESVKLLPGQSRDHPLRVYDPGKYRLRLDYSFDDHIDCSVGVPKHAKRAFSSVLQIN